MVDQTSHSALFSTNLQLASHGAQQVEKVSTGRDMTGVNVYIAKSLASSIPTPVLYHNYYVGECKDLIFGFNLQDYATARDLPDGEIPKIVRICIEEVDKRGLDVEGIYRVSSSATSSHLCPPLPRDQVSGRVASVNEVGLRGVERQEVYTHLSQLRHRIERNEEAFRFNHADDTYVIASLLKVCRQFIQPTGFVDINLDVSERASRTIVQVLFGRQDSAYR